jgi:hypothetical protein
MLILTVIIFCFDFFAFFFVNIDTQGKQPVATQQQYTPGPPQTTTQQNHDQQQHPFKDANDDVDDSSNVAPFKKFWLSVITNKTGVLVGGNLFFYTTTGLETKRICAITDHEDLNVQKLFEYDKMSMVLIGMFIVNFNY